MVMQAPDIPEVNEEPVRAPRLQPTATEETFGGGPGIEGINQSVQRLAQAGGEIATFEKIRADQTVVEDRQAKLMAAHNRLMYDPHEGVLASRGINAMPAYDKGWKEYQKTANDLSAGLHGEAQRGAFNKIALAMGDSFQRQGSAHVDQQIKEQDTSSFHSLIDNGIDSAAMAYGDAMHLKLVQGTLNDNAVQYAKRNGMTPDELTDMQSKINSKFHEAVLGRMLSDKQDVMAKNYYDQVKGEVTVPEINDRMAKAVEEGSYRGQSQRQSDDIWTKTGGNLAQAFTEANKVTDPELRDRVTQRLREKDSQVKEARVSDQENAYYEASQLVAKASKQGGVAGAQALRDMVGPDLWTRMSPTQQNGLTRFYLNDENSDKVLNDYRMLSPTERATQSQAEFETEVLPRLGKAERGEAIKMRNAALSNRIEATNTTDQAKAIVESVQQSGIINGFRPGVPLTKLKGDARAAYDAFHGDVQNDIDNFERNDLGGRRRASKQEVQKIVDQHILDSLGQKTSFISSTARTLGFSPQPAVPFTAIPESDKELILTKARRAGAVVTKEQVESAYDAFKRGDRAAFEKAFK